MSRSSRITVALEELKTAGVIRAYAQLDHRWIIHIGPDRENYFTSREAEAFITGAQAAMER